jgi:uncharacterized UPF0160 family protein
MSFLNKIFKHKKILVTHNGTFHTDDLFATATLSILLNGNIKVIRTRDPKIIESADYVYDVGGENIPEKNRFDHHQKGGAGKREDGVPYAAFGLVWKTYGEQICGSKEVADIIEKKVAGPIDAKDNGVDISRTIFPDIFPYSVESIFLSEVPTWKEENNNIDKIFNRQVKKVIELLKREIKITKDDVEGKKIILDSYGKTEDKRIIILENNFPRYLYQNTLSVLPEPVYLVYPSGHSDLWKIEAVKKSRDTMESRKPFPEIWRGVFDEEKLREVSGISDIIFCHQNGFLAETKSKSGAVKLAEKALLA